MIIVVIIIIIAITIIIRNTLTKTAAPRATTELTNTGATKCRNYLPII